MKIECIWKGAAILGESPVWHPALQALFWLDIERQYLYRYDKATQDIQEFKLTKRVSSFAVDSKGDFIAAWQKGVIRMTAEGQLSQSLNLLGERNDIGFNDGKCDRQGRFWTGTRDVAELEAKGALYCIEGPEKISDMDQNFYVVFNGPCFSLEGNRIYTANSPCQEIYTFDLDPITGALSNKRIFAKVAADAGYPDGMTVDSEGYLWSAHWGGWRITRYAPDGRIDRVIEMPVPNVTSVSFGDANLDKLYVTTAARDLDAAALQSAPLAGGTFVIDVGVKGLPEIAYRA